MIFKLIVTIVSIVVTAIVFHDLTNWKAFNENSETKTFDLKTFKSLFLLNPHRFYLHVEKEFPDYKRGLFYYTGNGEKKVPKTFLSSL